VVVADTYGHGFMNKVHKAQVFNSNSYENPLFDFKKILEIFLHPKVIQIIIDKISVTFV
jgi:hypothetical protein